jgi:hypothetical protein
MPDPILTMQANKVYFGTHCLPQACHTASERRGVFRVLYRSAESWVLVLVGWDRKTKNAVLGAFA